MHYTIPINAEPKNTAVIALSAELIKIVIKHGSKEK